MSVNKKGERNEYLENRKLLIELESKAYGDFDKALLTISSGAIVLSATFIEKSNFTANFCQLKLSWVLWVISICSQLISYLVSGKSMREELDILNKEYRGENVGKNKWFGYPTFLNILSISTFFIGMIAFLLFINHNI